MRPTATALFLAAAALVSAAGCFTKYQPPADVKTFERDDVGYVLALNLDVSGSFLRLMEERGWPFVAKLVRQFFRDRDTESDQIIISQLSGAPGQGPIWKGSPRDFRRKFGGAGAFKSYLGQFSPSGSRIFDSVTESLGYAQQHAGGKTKLLLVVLSDFEDNASAPGGEERLVRALDEFSRANGRVGFYWLPPTAAQTWEGHLKRLFPADRYVVVPDIVDAPKLPNLE
jgi:hypothetical protein